MELQLFAFNFVPFLLFISLLLIFISGWKKSRHFNAKQKLPPGPWNLPIIGSLHHFIGSSPPHRVLTDLARKHGPLMHLKVADLSVMVISSPRLAKEIMRDHDLVFADRPEILSIKVLCYDNSNIAFSPYGEYWRQMRKVVVTELLNSKSVRSFGPVRQDEGSRLIAAVEKSLEKPINLSEKITSYTSSMVSRAAFGKVPVDQNTFKPLLKQVVALSLGFGLANIFPSLRFVHLLCGSESKLLKAHHKLDMILNDVINEHIKNLETTKKGNGEFGEEDLIDILLKIKESSDLQFPFTNNSIKGILFDIFGAGTETSSSTMEWAMAELMRNPQVMAKAQSEIREALNGKKTIDESDIKGLRYLNLVIKETLRLHSVLIPRECREDVQIDGYNLPKKTSVLINAWAIGRDEEYWSDRESFIPERFENSPIDFSGNYFEFLPFGSGRRFCPGVSFGLANIELTLALLLYHFNWKLPDGLNPKDLDMSEMAGLTISRKNPLFLIPSLYDPSFDMSC